MSDTAKTVKKILNVISTVIVVLAVICAVLLVGVRLFGLDVRYVMSGSMDPELPTGSLIYIKKVDPHTELKVDDVITYALSKDDVSTHRITRIVPGTEMIADLDHMPLRFEVKGDANDAPDGTLVLCGNVLGKPVFHIPYLGYLASYIQTEQGRLTAISVGAVLLILVFLPDLLFDDKESGKKKKKKKDGDPEDVTSEENCTDDGHENASESTVTGEAELLAADADVSADTASKTDDETGDTAEEITETKASADAVVSEETQPEKELSTEE